MGTIKQLHGRLIVSGLHRNPFHMSKVLSFYALSPPYLPQAVLSFSQIENPNTFVFNTMLRAFAPSNAPTEALILYKQAAGLGLRQDHMTFPFLLQACARIPAAIEGQSIHSHALKLGFCCDVFVSNALINLYCSCKEHGYARKVFDEMPIRDLVSWNSLICGSGKVQRFRDVLSLFEQMRAADMKADGVTMVAVLSACKKLGEWELGEASVMYISENRVEVDVYLGNTLIDYYGRRGFVEEAQKVFDEMKDKNSMTMNAMIATLAKAGHLFSARKVFDAMLERDLVSWSSMVTGYCQSKNFLEAFELLRRMQVDNKKLDEIVAASALSACAHLVERKLGRSVHGYIQRNNINVDIYVGNSLVSMYSKCGYTKEAYRVFNGMERKDTQTWNSIILGMTTSGNVNAALELFSDMLRGEFRPDETTFLGVLVACVRSGSVDKGIEYFESMRGEHGLEPHMKHFGCVFDLLSRAGELDKALKFIGEMMRSPDAIVWRSLLGACKVRGNVTMAEHANKRLHQLDPTDNGNFDLLSNTYAEAQRWSDAVKSRDRMIKADIQKNPGCSMIEMSSSAVKA